MTLKELYGYQYVGARDGPAEAAHSVTVSSHDSMPAERCIVCDCNNLIPCYSEGAPFPKPRSLLGAESRCCNMDCSQIYTAKGINRTETRHANPLRQFALSLWSSQYEKGKCLQTWKQGTCLVLNSRGHERNHWL